MTNQEFIRDIAPAVRKYAAQYGYKYPSAVIAQACLESAYGASSLSAKYHNYFGIKGYPKWTGKVVNLATKEEYSPGTLTNITAAFCVYDSMDAGVKGYFDFLERNPRYKNLHDATSAEDYLQKIRDDHYATSNSYVQSCLNILYAYNLRRFDEPITPTGLKKVDVQTWLNVRSMPSIGSSVIGKLPPDTEVTVDRIDGDWSHIEGWVYSKYLF